jgi:hypothetical protein
LSDAVWIAGNYVRVEDNEWVSFAYGPFFTQEAAMTRAEDREKMLETLGSVAKDFEVDCVEVITYSQACKHFEETILSEFWDEWSKRDIEE